MKGFIRRTLPRNKFARGVTVLAGGAAAGQAILVLAAPILTRLYSPEDFGMLAVYTAMLSIVGVIASLRYQLAIPLPEDDEEAVHIVVLSLLVLLVITALTLLAILFFHEFIAQTLNMHTLADYLWLLPVGLLLMGVYQVFNYWAIRIKAFPAIARTKFSQPFVSVGIQVGGAMLGPFALLLGYVAGQAVGSYYLWRLTVQGRWEIVKKVRLSDLNNIAYRYRRFPIYSTWSAVLNTAGTHLPPILFAVLFNPMASGFYILAYRVLAMPIILVGQAITEVFISHAVQAERNNALAPLVEKLHRNLARIAVAPGLLLIFAGPELFALVFGPEWVDAGRFAQWMVPWLVMAFITAPLTQLIVVLERQRHDLLFQSSLLGVRILGLLIGAGSGDVLLAVGLFSIGSALVYLAFLIWLIMVSGNLFWTFISVYCSAIFLAAMVGSPVIIAYILGSDILVWWFALAVSVLFYALFCIRGAMSLYTNQDEGSLN